MHPLCQLFTMRALSLVAVLSTICILLSSSFTAAQSTATQSTLLAGTCAGGVPNDGTIPATWPVRNHVFTLTEDGNFVLVNGSSPGPRLIANQFDWLQVTVISQLANTSITAIHWHGLTLYETPYNDGVAGVTQCGQETATNVTYSFCAYPSGDYWYHSVSQLQTVRGLYGPLTIAPVVLNLTANGTLVSNVTLTAINTSVPQSFADDFVWMAADQYDTNSSFTDYAELPTPIGVLVNGVPSNETHIYTAGINATYLRLVNAGSTSSFTFSVDGANMNITALDGSQVAPFPVSSVTLSAGQRATAILDFTAIANYSSVYYRVARNAGTNPDWVGVLHIGVNDTVTSLPSYAVSDCTDLYSNGTSANCTLLSDNVPQPPINNTFSDVNGLQARPVNYEAIGASYYGAGVAGVPSAGYSLNLAILLRPVEGSSAVVPYINNDTFDSSPLNDQYISDFTLPTLYSTLLTLYNAGNTSNLTSTPSPVILSSSSIEYVIPTDGVVDIMLLNSDPVDHSFHMHGHHFWIVSASDAPLAEYQYAGNYLVRDTVAIPAAGWVKLRMVGNNPGVWLFSSATEVYLAQGFAVVLVESVDTLTPNTTTLPANQYALCNASLQAEVVSGIAAWHAANDPVTYSDTALSQTSRIVIGTVVGGVTGGVLIVIVICTLLGIKRDPVKVNKGNSSQSPIAVMSSPAERVALNPAEQTVTGTPELSEHRVVEVV